ncbi:hypothetical protein SAMN02745866_00605 [Alteromonadaceae bacterium Bs31]|nr:hypothetical protein SAMN02745866_00605 [Alteromonadaceae bacterium Bs31]
MLKNFVAIATLTFLSSFASAYSIVDTDVVSGKIASINSLQNTLVVQGFFGSKEEVMLKPSANIYFDGEQAALSDLSTGQSIKIKRTTYSPTTEKIEGEIVSLDRDSLSARIRVAYNEVVEVRFSDKVKVSGNVKGSDFNSLRKGQLVVVSAK